jgi:hypothetical protein
MEPANIVVMFAAVPARSKRPDRGIQIITFSLEFRIAKQHACGTLPPYSGVPLRFLVVPASRLPQCFSLIAI